MKKIYTLCLAAALIFAASCSPMDTPEGDSNPPIGSQRPIIMKSYVITATKDAETKITVADNGSALWEEGDVIRVYNANEAWDVKGYEATMTSGAGEQSATFTFDAPADRNEGFFVAYGVEESTTIDAAKAQLDIVVPAAVATSAKPILAGYTATKDEIGSVDLKAVAAYVKVTLTDEADAVRFFPVNNSAEKLAGTILLGADGSLSTYASDAQVLVSNPDDVFYVNLLPGTLSKGYIIDVQKGDAHMIKSVSYGKEYKLFTAGSFVKLKEIPAFAAATVSGTVSPVTTYTNRENDLSKRLKIYGASTSAVAVSGLSEALASHVEFAGYSCEDKTSTDGVFADDFAIGNHTVTAAYNFICGEVTIPLGSIDGTAHITGIPYSIPVNNKNGWTGNCSVSNNSIRLSCSANPTASYTVPCYIPSDLSNLSLVYETTAEERTVAGGTATIKMNNVSLDSFKLAGGIAHAASVKHNGTKEVGAANSMTFSMSISGSSGVATAYVLIKKVTLEY